MYLVCVDENVYENILYISGQEIEAFKNDHRANEGTTWKSTSYFIGKADSKTKNQQTGAKRPPMVQYSFDRKRNRAKSGVKSVNTVSRKKPLDEVNHSKLRSLIFEAALPFESGTFLERFVGFACISTWSRKRGL